MGWSDSSEGISVRLRSFLSYFKAREDKVFDDPELAKSGKWILERAEQKRSRRCLSKVLLANTRSACYFSIQGFAQPSREVWKNVSASSAHEESGARTSGAYPRLTVELGA